jgi:hypothetical protein
MTTWSKEHFGTIEKATDSLSRAAVAGAFVGLLLFIWAMFGH